MVSANPVVASSSARAPEDFSVRLMSDAPGLVEMKPQRRAVISVHFGPSSQMLCRHGNEPHHGVAVHGDVEIIPWGLRGSWELKERDAAFVMMVSPNLLHAAARESGIDSGAITLRSRFHVRDPQIEHIAWALKREMEQGSPCGRLYRDSLAMGLAAHLLRNEFGISTTAANRWQNFAG